MPVVDDGHVIAVLLLDPHLNDKLLQPLLLVADIQGLEQLD